MIQLFGTAQRSFSHGGIHPGDFKELTCNLGIQRIPFSKEYVLPLTQHLGAPSKPIVKVGQRVERGQKIADRGGFVSAVLHAPVSGWVRAIEQRPHPSGKIDDAIIIECDANSTQALADERELDWQSMEPKEIVDAIAEGGFVGLGGAAFPTHVKMSIPEGKHADFFLVNAAECEPYLTSDHRVMLERIDSIFHGIRISLKALGAKIAYIGAEINKQDALEKLNARIPADLPCEIIPLETKYPQGAEKMLTDAVLHREIPSGKLPIDSHVVINNVGTVAGIGDYFRYHQPLIERVVTMTGSGVKKPMNLLVPIGTPLQDLIDYCGGISEDVREVLYGGPMMGNSIRTLNVPILKGTSGVVFLTNEEVYQSKEYPCIHCAACVDACPVYLNPSQLGLFARVRKYEEMKALHVLDCMECGSCSYVCPSSIPLVQRFRVAKALLREQMAREKK